VSGRESLITVGAIAGGWALVQLMVWARAWREIRRERQLEQQRQTDMQMRRGFRELQRRGDLK
jgi:hypothetical protein